MDALAVRSAMLGRKYSLKSSILFEAFKEKEMGSDIHVMSWKVRMARIRSNMREKENT